MTKVRENVVSFTKPKGGTEILKQQLVQQLKEGDLKDINIVGSICHPDLIVKDKINIVWQHLSYDQPNVQYMADRRYVDSVDFFVFVSHWQFNRFREKFNIPEYKCFVIKNATHAFKEDRINTGGRIKLIYTSTPWRGLSVLTKAIENLNKIRDDFTVDVYSSTKIYGDKFAEMEKGKYEPLYERIKNTPNMEYKEFAPNETIRQELLKANIFSYPSIYEETSCLSAIEAMAAGCYVVTTNYGALPETCADFATIIEYEPNALQLADRYSNVLNAVLDEYKEGKLNETIELQRKYYNKYYSWETRINEWRNFLNYARATKKTT